MALKDWKKIKHSDFIEFIKGDAGIKIVDFESGDGVLPEPEKILKNIILHLSRGEYKPI